MPRAILISCLILFMLPELARAAELKPLILSQVDGGTITDRQPVEARLHQTVMLHAVLQRGRGDQSEYFSDFQGIARINGRDVKVRRWDGEGILWRWYKVEPLMQHAAKGNDPTVPSWLWYTNAYVPGSPKAAKGWIGFDKIEYRDNILSETAGSWRIIANAHPTDPRYNFGGGMGVMRFKLAGELGGKTLKTPGAEATNYLGIEPKVFRLSVRRDDSLVGHALGFLNVPGVFGSHDLQVERRIGVDCADLMVAAWRSKTGRKMEYTNVNGLIAQMKPVGGVWRLTRDGDLIPETAGEKPIHCEPGMVIVFDYPGTVRDYYDHIGMLYNVGKDGILNAHDQMLHTGPLEPRVNQIATQGGTKEQPTRVRVFRWKQ